MIRIENLKKSYPPAFTLNVPALSVEKGERVALIGLNGSGKSTLLRLLAGALTPDEGSVSFTGKPRVGYLPQTPYAFRGSVEYNVGLACPGGKADAEVFSLCRIEALRKKKMTELSGGERQRVFLARLLAGKFDLLLLDEPTSAADLSAGEALTETLLHWCETRGTTLIFSTHLPRQAFALSTRFLLFDGGKIAESGVPTALNAPETDFGRLFISQWKV